MRDGVRCAASTPARAGGRAGRAAAHDHARSAPRPGPSARPGRAGVGRRSRRWPDPGPRRRLPARALIRLGTPWGSGALERGDEVGGGHRRRVVVLDPAALTAPGLLGAEPGEQVVDLGRFGGRWGPTAGTFPGSGAGLVVRSATVRVSHPCTILIDLPDRGPRPTASALPGCLSTMVRTRYENLTPRTVAGVCQSVTLRTVRWSGRGRRRPASPAL